MGSSFRRVLYVNWSWELAGAGAEKRGENIHIRGRGSHHLEQLAVKSIPLGDALVQLVRHLRRTHHRPRTIHLESCQMQMRRGQKKKTKRKGRWAPLIIFYKYYMHYIRQRAGLGGIYLFKKGPPNKRHATSSHHARDGPAV